VHLCVRWRSYANHVTDIREFFFYCLLEFCVFAYSGVGRQQQDRQYMYNIALIRVRMTVVDVDKQCVTYSEYVCSLCYLTCSAHARYLWLI
jgi:hypothetical protein